MLLKPMCWSTIGVEGLLLRCLHFPAAIEQHSGLITFWRWKVPAYRLLPGDACYPHKRHGLIKV